MLVVKIKKGILQANLLQEGRTFNDQNLQIEDKRDANRLRG